jgi:hypothetical protein
VNRGRPFTGSRYRHLIKKYAIYLVLGLSCFHNRFHNKAV